MARRGFFKSALSRISLSTQNAVDIVRMGRLAAPYGSPYEVIHHDRVRRVRRYEGRRASAGSPVPLLLVPPLMVTSEIYDMAPEVSAVGALLEAGVDVFSVDFGAPEREEGGMERTLDDHVRAVSTAIEEVARLTSRDVHVAGYSQGGMFCYQAAALRRSNNVASVITMGSPVDIHRNLPNVSDGVAAEIIRGLRSAIDKPLTALEGLPGVLTSTGFKALSIRKEVGQVADFVRKLHDREALERREARRKFLGGEGFVAWPGPALRTFIDEFIVHNRMTSGGFVIDGRTITLADIRCPVLYFVGETDDIARPPAVRAIRAAAPNAEVYEVAFRAGHFGLVVGSKSQRVTWPTIAEWMRWREDEGPRPRELPRARSVPVASQEPEDVAFANADFNISLFYDSLFETAGSLWHRVGEATREFGGLYDAARWQVPRLQRLKSLTPETTLSMGAELDARANDAPDATFFLYRGRAFSYAQANERVDHVVRGLIASGVHAGDRVGVLMGARPSYLTVVAALSRIGAVSVLLSPTSTRLPLAQALTQSEVARVITDPENAREAREAFSGAVLILGGARETRELPENVVDLEQIDPATVPLPAWYSPNPGRARDVAMLLFTATKSEQPRLSRITNRRWAFAALGAAAACSLTPKDTVYCCLPLHHPAGMLVCVGSALVGSARLALGRPWGEETRRDAPTAIDPVLFWEEVRRYGATVVFYAGELLRPVTNAEVSGNDHNNPVRLFAGSGLRTPVWRALRDRFSAVVLEFYASTEGNAVLANTSGQKIGALGRPIPGSAELAVVAFNTTAQDFTRDASGWAVRTIVDEVGMLIARMDATHPGGDEARVLRDVFERGDRWHITGDLVHQDLDGDYWFAGRARDVLHTSDGIVTPRAIERALTDLPCVAYLATIDGRRCIGIAIRGDRDEEALAVRVRKLPPHQRPAAVRWVDHFPMTDGYRPIKNAFASEPLKHPSARWDEETMSYVGE